MTRVDPGRSGTWAAPGRVNLIGEHTDYNDGFVLPLALPNRVVARAAVTDSPLTRVRSRQAPGQTVSFDAQTVEPGEVGGWAAYVAGVFWALRSDGHALGNLDLELDGDIPLGAGLSSSAALECATGLAVTDLFGLALGSSELARICQRAENEFVGAPTGIMDQMASVHGRAGHLVFLDTRTLAVEHVPFDPAADGLSLLVVDTRAPHRLVDSEYADRRRACEEAAAALGVSALRDATPTDIGPLPPQLAARARHVVTENARVLAVVRALRSGTDPREIAPLLTASHESLRDDFEVTVPEVDVAFDTLLATGAYGARITGGGFGGCVIALIDSDRVAAATAAVNSSFSAAGFAAPSAFSAVPSAGAHRLT